MLKSTQSIDKMSVTATEIESILPTEALDTAHGTQYIEMYVYHMAYDEMFKDIITSITDGVSLANEGTALGAIDTAKEDGIIAKFKSMTEGISKYLKKGDFIGNIDTSSQDVLYLPLPNVLREVHHQMYEDSFYNLEERLVRNGVKLTQETIRALAGSKGGQIAEGLGSIVELADHMMRRANIASDPNNLLVYSGSAPRTHTFSFNIVPRNNKEALYYMQVIEKLKLYSLAKKEALADPFDNALTLNSIRQGYLFAFKFVILEVKDDKKKFAKNAHLDTIFAGDDTITKGFALSNITSTIGDDGLLLYADGSPKAITLSLTFTERKPMWHTEIKDFYEKRLKEY